MRKTMPKNSKKPTRSKLVKKLDVIFSQYIRLRNADKHGMVKCFTCGKRGHWKNDGMQAGHFMSRRHYSTRWDEDNVQVQCLSCNIYQQGLQYVYSKKLGEQTSNRLYLQSQQTVKYTNADIEAMIADYSDKVKRLV